MILRMINMFINWHILFHLINISYLPRVYKTIKIEIDGLQNMLEEKYRSSDSRENTCDWCLNIYDVRFSLIHDYYYYSFNTKHEL